MAGWHESRDGGKGRTTGPSPAGYDSCHHQSVGQLSATGYDGCGGGGCGDDAVRDAATQARGETQVPLAAAAAEW